MHQNNFYMREPFAALFFWGRRMPGRERTTQTRSFCPRTCEESHAETWYGPRAAEQAGEVGTHRQHRCHGTREQLTTKAALVWQVFADREGAPSQVPTLCASPQTQGISLGGGGVNWFENQLSIYIFWAGVKTGYQALGWSCRIFLS